MGSNWSALQERSYFSEAFFHTVVTRLDSDPRRIFSFETCRQPSAVTGGCIKKKNPPNIWKNQHGAGKWHHKTECAGLAVCAASPFFEISHARWTYTITVHAFGSSRGHFTHPQTAERVWTLMTSNLLCHAGLEAHQGKNRPTAQSAVNRFLDSSLMHKAHLHFLAWPHEKAAVFPYIKV